MADTTKIVFTMSTADGEKNFSYLDANPSASESAVKAVGQALITNGSIFANPPLEVKSAKLVTVTEEEYDLSD